MIYAHLPPPGRWKHWTLQWDGGRRDKSNLYSTVNARELPAVFGLGKVLPAEYRIKKMNCAPYQGLGNVFHLQRFLLYIFVLNSPCFNRQNRKITDHWAGEFFFPKFLLEMSLRKTMVKPWGLWEWKLHPFMWVQAKLLPYLMCCGL